MPEKPAVATGRNNRRLKFHAALLISSILGATIFCSNAFCAPNALVPTSRFNGQGGSGHIHGTFAHHSHPGGPISHLPSTTPFNVSIVQGQGAIRQFGDVTVIRINTPSAILEGNLSTNYGDIVKIRMPSSDDSVLLRSTTGLATSADGYYWSNGNLYMINPAGIVFGTTAQVHAANLVVSTLDISNTDFTEGINTGQFHFSGQGAYIINQGQLIPQPGGYVCLLSQAIRNEGTIQAQLGKIVLAAGEDMTLTTVNLDDRGTIFVAIDKAVESQILGPSGEAFNDAIKNKGLLSANGGTVTLTAKVLNTIFDHAINNSGIVEAKVASTGQNGDVILKAEGAPVLNSGTVEAAKVTVKGKNAAFINRGDVTSDSGDVTIKLKNAALINKGNILSKSGNITIKLKNSKFINKGNVISKSGNVNIKLKNSTFVNKGQVIAQAPATIPAVGNITIKATNVIQDGTISAKNLVSITAEDAVSTTLPTLIDTPQNTVNQGPYSPEGSPVAVISGSQVSITARSIGSYGNAIKVDSPITSFYITAGDIDIAESLGIGTSILLRGPPNGNFSIIYNNATNLTLDAIAGAIHVAPGAKICSQDLTLLGNTGIYSEGTLQAPGVLTLTSPGPISSLGILSSGALNEAGASFAISGSFSPGTANVINADNALTLSGTISLGSPGSTTNVEDDGNIIIGSATTITLAGPVVFHADVHGLYNAATHDKGAFTMTDSTSVIDGQGAYSLTIMASKPSALYAINNVEALVLEESEPGSNPSFVFNMPVTVPNFTLLSGTVTLNDVVTFTAHIVLTVNGAYSQSGGTFNEDTDSSGNNLFSLGVGAPVVLTGGSSIFRGPDYGSGGSGQSTTVAAIRVYDVSDLGSIHSHLSGNYVQTASFSCSGVSDFTPYIIGSSSTVGFSGTYNGNGYSISSLTILSNSGTNSVGLFGGVTTSGSLSNINLSTVNITGVEEYTGALVGVNSGTITGCSVVTGTVTGKENANATSYNDAGYTGGLVGSSSGSISNSYANSVTVNGWGLVGGLAGRNTGSISTSYVSGSVTINGGSVYTDNFESITGGLVGVNGQAGSTATITNCYATVSVSGGGTVGGFAGVNEDGSITGSYATGTVTNTTTQAEYDTNQDRDQGGQAGGLAGENGVDEDGGSSTISNCYAVGNVSGGYGGTAGGLVGGNFGGTIQTSYATGTVNASGATGESSTNPSAVGGLVGFNGVNDYDNGSKTTSPGTISNSYATGVVSVTVISISSDISAAGGLVGANNGNINNCFAAGNVIGGVSLLGAAGGLVGVTNIPTAGSTSTGASTSVITNSFSTGTVSGSYAGGFLGYNLLINLVYPGLPAATGSTSKILNCAWYNYSGSISAIGNGTNSGNFGTITGNPNFYGTNESTKSNFYSTSEAVYAQSSVPPGTTAWDFVSTWIMPSSVGPPNYPLLSYWTPVKFEFTNFSSDSVTAGSSLSATVTAENDSGQTVASYTGTVTFTSSDTQAGLPSNYTFTASDDGTHIFTSAFTFKTAGSQTITATDSAYSILTGTSKDISVNAAIANKLVIEIQPAGTGSVDNALTTQPTVQVTDQFGNNVADSGVTVTATLSSGTGTLRGTTATTSGTGLATFASLGYSKSGETFTVTFTATGGLTSPASSSVGPLTPGAAAALAIKTQPAGAGSVDNALTTQPAIQVVDQFGNNVADSGVTITANRTSGTGTLRGTTATTSGTGLATFASLGYSKSGETFTVTFTATGGLTSPASSSVGPLTPGAATTLSITTQPAGTGSVDNALTTQPAIQVVDQFGNNVASGVTVTATLNSGTGTLRGTTATTSGTTGLATFAGLGYSKSGETFSIIFSSNGHSTAASSSIGPLTPGAAATLSITTQPAGTGSVDNALTTQPAIQVVDQYGNNVASGVTVTATLSSGTGTLRNTTATTSGTTGLATFASLGYSKSGQTFSIIFSSNGHSTAASSNIGPLTPGAAATLSITTQPAGTGSVDNALTTQPAIQVVDQYGNNVASGVTVTATLTTGTGTLRGTTATTSGTGLATFAGLGYSKSGETFTVTFTATGGLTSPASSSIGPLTPGAAATLSITTQPAGTGSVDNALTTQPAIQVVDQFGNNVASGVTVTATLSSGTGTLRNTTATTSGTTGLATFASLGYSKSGETFSIIFSSNGHSTAASSNIGPLTPGAAATLSITTQPAGTGSVDNALTTQPAIQVVDQFGNNVASGVTVTATLNSGTGTLRGTTATTSGTTGLATFASLGYSKSGETFSIIFSSNGHSTAASSSIGPLTPGAAATLSITTQPAGTGSVDNALTTQPAIQVVDQYGNNVASGVTVTATLTTGTGTLRGTTATTSGTGLATFAGLGYSKSGETFTVTFTATGGLTSPASSSIGPLTPGAAATLSITTQPAGTGSVDNALTTQPAIQVVDQFGNNVASGVTVTATLSSGTGTLRNTTATTSGTTGLATFASLGYSKSGETFSIIFSSNGHSTAASSNIGPLTPGAAATLSITTQPAGTGSVDNALTTQPAIQVVDQYGNNVASGVTVTATLSSGTGTLRNTTATTSGTTGLATFASLGYSKSGQTFSIIFSSNGHSTAASSSIGPLTPGAAASLSITTQPAGTGSVDNALTTQPAIQVVDQYGNNVASGVTVTATLTTGTGTLRGTTATTSGTGLATFAGLGYSKSGETFTVTFTATGGLTSPASSSIGPLTPGAAATLSITTQPAGTGSVDNALTTQPAIQVVDQYGNNVASGVTVTATLNSGTGTLRNTTATTSGTTGLATFASLGYSKSGETFSIIFSSNGHSTAASSSIGPLTPGAAATLSITTQPAGTGSVDNALTTQPAIQVVDQFGNNVASGVTVTATLNSGTGTLRNTTATTSGTTGLATFASLGYSKSGETFSIIFSSNGHSTSSSSSIGPLTPGAAAALSITTQPAGTGSVDNALTTQPAVQVVDQFGNNVADSGLTITANRTSGTGTLRGTTATTSGTGLATFAGLGYSKSGETFTVTFTATGGLTSPASSSVGPLTPGVAATLSITTQPAGTGSVDNALTTQPAIQVVDQFGNNVASGVTVTATLSSGTGTLRNTTATTSGTTGLATFAGLGYSKSGETFSIIFSSNGHSTAASSNIGPLTPGAAATLSITTQPAGTGSVDNALTTQPAIQVVDQYGNNVASGVTVTATLSSGTGTLRNTTATTSGTTGLATFASLGYSKSGETFSIIFSSNGHSTASSSSIGPLTPGAATTLSITTQPAGTGSVDNVLTTQPAIQVVDQFGNNVASGVTVTATLNSGTGTLRNTTATTSGTTGLATFASLGYSKSGETFSIIFSSNGHSTAASSNIGPLTPGAAATLSITTQPAGTGSVDNALTTQPAIQVVDQYGNNVASGVTVTATLSSGTGTLRNTTATTSGTTGLATFASLGYSKSGETFSIIFSSNGHSTAASSSIGPLTPGAAATLSITTQPAGTGSVDNALTTQPAIQVVDQYGNNVASGVTVTATLSSGTGTLRNTTATTSGTTGLATFASLGYSKSGETFSIIFSSNGHSTAASSSIGPLTPGAAASLSITTQPAGTGSVDNALTTQPIVQVVDQFGNNVADSGVTITANRTSGTGTLRSTTATTSGTGLATFAGLGYSKSGETFTVTFTATGGLTSPASSSIGPLTPGAAASLSITTQPAGTGSVDNALTTQPAIQVVDQFGNNVASGVTVTATLSSGTGTLRNTTATTSGTTGLATFASLGYSKSGETFSIIFSSNGHSTAASSNIGPLTPGAAAKIAIITQPAGTGSVDNPLTTQPIVQVTDQFGNIVADSGVTITATLNSGTGILRGTTAVTSGAGLATFAGLGYSKSAETFNILFTATGGLISPASSNIGPLTPGAATNLFFSQQPANTTVNTVISPAITVQVRDQFNNVCTNYTPTAMNITIAGANLNHVVLNGTTSVVTSNGAATFNDINIGAVGTYALQATLGSFTTLSNQFNIMIPVSYTVIFSNYSVLIVEINEQTNRNSFSNLYIISQLQNPQGLVDMTAFGDVILSAGDYTFVNGSISLIGYPDLISLFEGFDKIRP